MELGAEKEPLIEPEVQAFVYSLVSALGGQSIGEDGRYAVGDDALAVLKDIKRWLRLYDDKSGRLDVARLLADANLVRGDLLEILSVWPEDAQEDSLISRSVLLCVDLLTQLTWPLQLDDQRSLLNRHLHIPYLRKAQVSYKQAVLHHDTTQMLRTVVRVGLPAMAQPQKERSPQEDNIIKVVLYFFRNIAMIEATDDAVDYEVDCDIARSATVNAFHSQDIFDLLLTICSNMAEQYSTHDVEVLDILYHLVKGVDVAILFMEKDEVVSSHTKELQALMGKERGMLAGYARYAPSRHNKFGTMLWVKRDNGSRSTVFGQAAIGNEQLTMVEMDKKKTWNRPKRPAKKDETNMPSIAFEMSAHLTAVARKRLRLFIERFLDSSFNPLFTAIRRAIEREADRILDVHKRQYLYLISWFLRAQSARRQKRDVEKPQQSSMPRADTEDYALVAAVLDQETFVLLNRLMQSAQDEKRWQDLNAGMKCFTQILLTVQDMFESPMEDDQEIAENILNRIFYEQSTHDRIIGLLRTYKDQEFGYLDACTELSHVFLRLLERYSKQNVDLQVRSRRRARKKKRQTENPGNDPSADVENQELEAEDVAEAQKTTNERKFDFTRFAARFINQASVDTYISFLKFWRELSDEQLKRAHRFFYRVAFKMELTVLLLRLDVIALFHKLVKGPDGLNVDNVTFKEWEELARQVFRRLVKRMQDRPALAVELLFSKISSTTYYLEHGHDKEIPRRGPRVPATLEVKPGMDKEQELGIAVSILINQGKSDALAWLKEILSSAASERKAWEEAATALKSVETNGVPEDGSERTDAVHMDPESTTSQANGEQQHQQHEHPKASSIFVKADSIERKRAMRQDKHLRLLMTLLSLIAFVEDDTDSTWIVPSALTSAELTASVDVINRFEFSPPIYEDGKSAEDFVRRKPTAAPRTRAAAKGTMDTDSEGDSASDLDEQLFPAGGPTARQSSPSEPRTKLKRRRNRHAPEEPLDDTVLDERREARRKKEADKNRKIKSALLVRESDDETDEERDRAFFELEEERRRRHASGLFKVTREGGEGKAKRGKKTRADRKRGVSGGTVSDNDDYDEDHDAMRPGKRRKSGLEILLRDADSDESVDDLDASFHASGSGRGDNRRARRDSHRRAFDDDSDGVASSVSDESNPEAGTAGTDTDTESGNGTPRPRSRPTSPFLDRPSSIAKRGHDIAPLSDGQRQRDVDLDADADMDVDMDTNSTNAAVAEADEHGTDSEAGGSDKENTDVHARLEGGGRKDVQGVLKRRGMMRAIVVDSDDE